MHLKLRTDGPRISSDKIQSAFSDETPIEFDIQSDGEHDEDDQGNSEQSCIKFVTFG